MSVIVLSHANRKLVHDRLAEGVWVVACLCADWCDVCAAFQATFDGLASTHPEHLFLWIDIEDEADLVGDIDVENFPTLLIERHGKATFYGTVEPAAGPLGRLVQARIGGIPSALSVAAPSGRIDLQARLTAAIAG